MGGPCGRLCSAALPLRMRDQVAEMSAVAAAVAVTTPAEGGCGVGRLAAGAAATVLAADVFSAFGWA